MAKLKITKQELKKQRDSLARFQRYLPTLQLKKKQLQQQILKVHQEINKVAGQEEDFRNQVIHWVDLFAQDNPIEEAVKVLAIKTKKENIAGLDLPVFAEVEFETSQPDLLKTPLWVDFGIEAVKEMIIYKAQLIILHKQLDILKHELRVANQRVNLFEKVKIPEAQDNIRIIQIYLGERGTAAVVRGKIAKAKIETKKVA